jgi:hypothetical protein
VLPSLENGGVALFGWSGDDNNIEATNSNNTTLWIVDTKEVKLKR